jgi:hypothetical protein
MNTYPGGSDEPIEWYGVRTIYHWTEKGAFEERVTMWKARSLALALEQAEIEAHEYETEEVQYCGFAQAYRTTAEDLPIEPSVEVFSLLRHSALSPDEYVTKFFDTGTEIGLPREI